MTQKKKYNKIYFRAHCFYHEWVVSVKLYHLETMEGMEWRNIRSFNEFPEIFGGISGGFPGGIPGLILGVIFGGTVGYIPPCNRPGIGPGVPRGVPG